MPDKSLDSAAFTNNNQAPLSASPVSEPIPASPKTGSSRLIVISLVVLIITGLLVIGFLVMRRLSSSQDALPLVSLSPSPNTSPESSPTASVDPLVNAGPLTPKSVPPVETWTNLIVAVKYTSSPSFTVSIDSLYRTASKGEAPTPFNPDRYTVLQVKDNTGQILSEQKFTLITQVVMEGQDLTPAINISPAGSQRIFVPIPAYSQPASIELRQSDGTLIESRPLIYPQLPLDPVYVLSSPAPEVSSEITSTPEVLGTTDGQVLADTSHSKMIIAITADKGADRFLNGTVIIAQQMIRNFEPWSKYADKIEILPVPIGIELGCQSVVGPNGAYYPACFNQENYIIEQIGMRTGVIPHAVVVALSTKCNCGSVGFSGSGFSNVVAVGYQTTFDTLTHEFGHAVGQMADEYMYLHGGSSYKDSNCFSSQEDCEYYASQLDGMECTQGCNIAGNWRPASKIMYNNYSELSFGPWEYCIMDKMLADFFGLEPEEQCVFESPSPGSGNNSLYWGWHR